MPTIAEAGVPGYDHGPWNGMLAPSRTPQPIIARLNAEVVEAAQAQDMRNVLAPEGAEPVGNSAEAFGAIIREETAKWAKVIRAAGLRAD